MAEDLQNDRYQALVEQMSIPKSTKVTMTLWGFNIFDLGAVALGVGIGIWLTNVFDTKPIFKVALLALGTITSILLIMRTTYQRKVRNFIVLKSVLMQDKGHYYPIRIKEEKTKR